LIRIFDANSKMIVDPPMDMEEGNRKYRILEGSLVAVSGNEFVCLMANFNTLPIEEIRFFRVTYK
jgi:hypothetical protein